MSAGDGVPPEGVPWWMRDLGPLAVLLLAGLGLAATHLSADVGLYRHDAEAMLRLPLSAALPSQYPALAGGLFVLVRVLPFAYQDGFAVIAALAMVAMVAAGPSHVARPGWPRRLLVYLALGTVWVLLLRYDVVSSMLALAAVDQARRRRWGWAWCAALIGTGVQLFPALLIPAFFAVEWRERRRPPWLRGLAGACALGAAALAQQLLAPGTLLAPFRYEMRRGFEVWSLPGTLTAVLDPLHLRLVHQFGTFEIVGRYAGSIGLAMDVLALVSLATVWGLAARGRLDVVAVSLATLSVAVAFDRAFPPQYLIWLAPLWAYYELRTGWLATASLTTLIYPVAWLFTERFHWSFLFPTALGGLRNAVFLAATATWLAAQLWPRSADAAPVPAGGSLGEGW